MNSLDRAKRFLASKTAKLALTAVPLAMAVPAVRAQQNSVTFNTGNCVVETGSGTCTVTDFQSTGGNPLANWEDIFASGSLFPSDGSLTVFTDGSASGTVTSGESFPVSWDFGFFQETGQNANQSSVAPLDVAVSFGIDYSTGSGSFSRDLGNVGTGTTIGSGTFTLPTSINSGGATITGYSIEISATNVPSGYRLNIPQGTSLDLNDVPSSTPEPGSVALAGIGFAGAGLLGLFRRFRRRKV